METTENNQVAIIEKSLDVLKTGPEILISNQARKEKALAVGRNILAEIESTGMNSQLDERANKYLANISKANSEMKDNRAPVTQIMDQLKKMYTEVENEIDVKKPGTIPAKIQEFRNEYARQVAEEANRKRKEAEARAEKEKEAIEIRTYATNKLNEQFLQWLLSKKTAMTEFFNRATLDTFSACEEKLTHAKIEASFAPSEFSTSFAFRHNVNEIRDMNLSVYEELMEDFKNTTIAELTMHRDELVEKLPSKKAELVEAKRLADEAAEAARKAVEEEAKRQAAIATAKAAERKRLEQEAEKAREEEAKRQAELKAEQDRLDAERKKREEEENARLAAEAEDARKKSEQEAEIKKQGEQTMAMFEKEAAMADTAPAPETRQGYDIQVLHPVGYTQLFAFWFENEGKNLPVDKIGNTKLDQIKSWAEKFAQKTGAKIDSKFLKYEESFKAVNRKAK